MASPKGRSHLMATLLVLSSSSAFGFPQAITPSPVSKAPVLGTLLGSIQSVSSAGPFPSAASVSLPANITNITLPDTDNTGYQNTSAIPATPIAPGLPDLPDYAITYAPIVYLEQNESYWPSAWDTHLSYVYPWINYVPLTNVPNPLTLENLNFTTTNTLYLSIADPAQQPRPEWLYSSYGKPDSTGLSASNVTVIAVNKTESIAPGVVDVFYFLLYSFNEGDNVGGETYGNHISDVEYIMTRFYSGVPRYFFMSQHQDGEAYEWAAVQKENNTRPIAYSAIGGHANYPVAGTFELVQGLIGLLEDQTTAGWRWDTAKNYNGYWYSAIDGFVPASGMYASTNPKGPPGVGYLQQTGKWGNQALPVSDPNQAKIFGQEEWSDGGTGPIDPSKGLARTWLCVQSDCIANSSLPATTKVQAGQLAATSAAVTRFSLTRTLLVLLPALMILL